MLQERGVTAFYLASTTKTKLLHFSSKPGRRVLGESPAWITRLPARLSPQHRLHEPPNLMLLLPVFRFQRTRLPQQLLNLRDDGLLFGERGDGNTSKLREICSWPGNAVYRMI